MAKQEAKQKKAINYYQQVEVVDIDGNTFFINSTLEGPLKVEVCHLSHPAYNPTRVVERKAKGRMEKFLEKQKKVDALKK